MVIEAFCSVFFWIGHFLIGLFPKFPSFGDLSTFFDPIFYVLRLLNNFINLNVVSKGFVILLLVYNIKFVWSIIMWLVRKIPGVS